jgi:hypothetical protein
MPLTEQQRGSIDRLVNKQSRNTFEPTFMAFLFSKLQNADWQLQNAVRNMQGIFREPLNESARVVVRQHILYLMIKNAEDSWVVGRQQLGDQWNLTQFSQALRSPLHGEDTCHYTRPQVDTLHGLCEHYAQRIRDEDLAPTLSTYIQTETARLQQLPELMGVEFAAIEHKLLGMAQSTIYNVLVKFKPYKP